MAYGTGMRTIDIDPDRVDSIADTLSDETDVLRSVLELIDKIIENIETAWVSEYTQDYLDCVRATRRRLNNLFGNIEDAAKDLKKTSDKVRRAEREAKEILARMNEGGSGGGSGHRI